MEKFNADDFLAYCKENIPYYESRANYAWDKIDKNRCPLSMADNALYRDIEDCLEDYCYDNGLDIDDVLLEFDIEDLF